MPVCEYENEANRFFFPCVSSFPVVIEARGLNDIGAEEGGNFILIWF